MEMLRAIWTAPYTECLAHLRHWSREHPVLPPAFFTALQCTLDAHATLEWCGWNEHAIQGRLFPDLYACVPWRVAQKTTALCFSERKRWRLNGTAVIEKNNQRARIRARWRKVHPDNQTYFNLFDKMRIALARNYLPDVFSHIMPEWLRANRAEALFWLFFWLEDKGSALYEEASYIRYELMTRALVDVLGFRQAEFAKWLRCESYVWHLLCHVQDALLKSTPWATCRDSYIADTRPYLRDEAVVNHDYLVSELDTIYKHMEQSFSSPQ
jgi:hypothetical protein